MLAKQQEQQLAQAIDNHGFNHLTCADCLLQVDSHLAVDFFNHPKP